MISFKYFTLGLIFTLVANIISAQIEPIKPRDIIAIRGSAATSYDWHPEINKMRTIDRYHVRDAFSNIFYNLNAAVPVNVQNTDDMVNETTGVPSNFNYNEVMAWGHDVGGLVARGLRIENQKVNTLLLTGTPNRGSNLLRDIISNQSTNSTLVPLETWMEDLQKWKGDDVKCPDCDKPQRILDFIERLKDNSDFLQGGQNDPLGYYQFLPDPDPSTTIVLWGQANQQKLGDFLGSMGGISNSSFLDLEGCSRRLKIIRQAKLDNLKLIRQIDQVNGFFGTIKNFLQFTLLKPEKDKDGKITWPSLTNILSKLIDQIKTESTKLIDNIKQDEVIQKETRDLLLCELANQRMEAEWLHRIMSGTGQLTTTYVPNPTNDPVKCTYYQNQCQYNSQHPNHASFCYYADLYCPDVYFGIVTEENDLMYTRTEQTLSSNVKYTGKMDNTNHFQEQQWERIKPHVDPYFLNKLDPFHIPKN